MTSLSRGTITIMTDPTPTSSQYYAELVKAGIRPVIRKLDGKPPLKKPKYGGHYAVTRSLIDGLQKAGIPFIYNPPKLFDCTERVIVLSGLLTLKQAIALRKKGIIKKLAAGPNLVVLPSDSPELIRSEYIDRCIVNSDWVRNLYVADMPELEPKLIVWPAGVDEKAWDPAGTPKNPRSLLFYSKTPAGNLFRDCLQIAEAAGFVVSVIEYGSYTPAQFKTSLDANSMMVYFSATESQGIALAEAWSMNVPTITWNPGIFQLKGHTVVSSSAPYLTEETGVFFRDAPDFGRVIDKLAADSFAFDPRKWILSHQTDELSARHLMELMEF